MGVSRPARAPRRRHHQSRPFRVLDRGTRVERGRSGRLGSLPEVRLPGGDGHVEIRVYNSSVEDFDKSKELLKQDRFRFRGGTAKYWWRLVPRTSGIDAALCSERPGHNTPASG